MTRLIQLGAFGVAQTLALAAVISVNAQRRPAATEPTSVTVRLPEQPADQGYVGEERCRSCHRAELTQFHKTPHASVKSETSAQGMNCETCHGPGKAHADGAEAARGNDAAIAAASRLIFAFRGTTQENAQRCLTCHVSSRTQQGFGHSPHAAAGVACQSCHATHLVEAARPSSVPAPPTALAPTRIRR